MECLSETLILVFVGLYLCTVSFEDGLTSVSVLFLGSANSAYGVS